MANPAAENVVDAVDHSAHATTAMVEHPAGAEGGHHGPEALGLGASGWVGMAMLVFLVLLIWKKIPGVIAGGLDAKIAEIKHQLDEAKHLRAEAEALRQEYADKIANAEKDAAAMIEHAQHEADGIVAKAEADSTAMIARRQKMAEDKIAAAERGAVEELRAKAASAAAAAARGLIAEKHDASADKKLVDQAISAI
jgi:F-type H+-transporting ATPase subunit b